MTTAINTDAIMKAFNARLSAGRISDEKTCIVCYGQHANWLADLQDCLEDAGVPLDRFCGKPEKNRSEPFTVIRGRLRLTSASQCVSACHIRGMLEELNTVVE